MTTSLPLSIFPLIIIVPWVLTKFEYMSDRSLSFVPVYTEFKISKTYFQICFKGFNWYILEMLPDIRCQSWSFVCLTMDLHSRIEQLSKKVCDDRFFFCYQRQNIGSHRRGHDLLINRKQLRLECFISLLAIVATAAQKLLYV